jgi:hypothetical protein
MNILSENVDVVFAAELQPWHRFYTPASSPAETGFAGPWFERIDADATSVTVHTVNGGERTLKNDTLVTVVTPSFPTT